MSVCNAIIHFSDNTHHIATLYGMDTEEFKRILMTQGFELPTTLGKVVWYPPSAIAKVIITSR